MRNIVAFVLAGILLLIEGCSGSFLKTNINEPDVYLYGFYGDINETYCYNPVYDLEDICGEKIACLYNDVLYVKLNDGIYRIDGEELKLIYEHTDSIFSIVGFNQKCVAFIATDAEDDMEKSVYLLNLDGGSLQEYKCFYACMEEEYLVISSSTTVKDTFYSFIETDGSNPAKVITYYENGEGELPDAYEDKESLEEKKLDEKNQEKYHPVIYNKDENRDLQITDYIYCADSFQEVPPYTKMNDAIYNQIGEKIIKLIVSDNRRNHITEFILGTAKHCDTGVWSEDRISVYDGDTEEETSIYRDSKNRILGYNYSANTVYLYSFEDKTVIAKDLNTDVVTTIAALDESQKIKFTWCNTTLVWIYENDGVETYGGNLQL